MGKSYEVKMKKEFDKICGNSCNEMVNITYADLSKYIKKKAESMDKDKIELIKIKLQRRKVNFHEIRNIITGILIPIFISFFSTQSDYFPYSYIFWVVYIPYFLLFSIINSRKEELYRELYDLIEKAIQETYHTKQ